MASDQAPAPVAAETLKSFAEAVFSHFGVGASDAALWADVLVWADLRGVSSHGVMRIPSYVAHLENGDINPRPAMATIFDAGALTILDADRAPGPVGLSAAMAQAIAGAGAHGVGWCVARGLTHPGAIGYFALQAAKRGMIGMCMSASQPLMAYHGARAPGVSTNPVTIAVPSATNGELCLDMATSNVAMGKILHARQTGAAVPADWGLDKQGQPTTDAALVEMLQPLGGPKGSGLSLMIECMTSLFAGFPLLEPVLRTGVPIAGRPMNALAVAIRVPDAAGFAQSVDGLAEVIHDLPKAEGVAQVFLPGERGNLLLAQRQRQGIPLPRKIRDDLIDIGQRLGIRADALS
jgi:LDH2 family malate/lactate/ureidoglycolate dehydrogenase